MQTKETKMYPNFIQFETRRWQFERELQLIRERERAARMQSPDRIVRRGAPRRKLAQGA
jgi:hypothetical protein